MELGLAGKVVLITGAAQGIGRACAQGFAAEGARLALLDLKAEGLEQTALLAGRTEGPVLTLAADVSDPEDVQLAIESVLTHFERLDVLVNCHGVFAAKPIPQIAAEEWDRVMAVNLRGTFLVCRAAGEVMKGQGCGKIIIFASLAGQVGGVVAGADYSASKAGVACLTKSLAKYLGPHGVNVNCINPGAVETPMLQQWPEGAIEQVIKQIPQGRIARPEELAKVVLFLASEVAAHIHGAHIDVNGGLYMD